jgi:VWFA-related protein
MTRTMNRTLTLAVPVLGIFILFLCVPGDIFPQIAPSAQQPPASPQSAPPAARPPQQLPPSPQGPTPPKSQTPLTVVSRAVIVPVTVKDSHGQLVGDLQKADFRVFEDNVEQQIATFSSEAAPLSAVVLIDNDLSEKSAGPVQKSLVSIAAGFGPSDETALVTYDEFPKTVFDFSADNDKLFTQLKRLELSSHSTAIANDPTTAGPIINGQKPPDGTGIPLHGSARVKTHNDLDDALFAAGQMLKERGVGRRKIVFLISDGTDSRNNSHSFNETLLSLYAADVSVYSISVNRSLPIGKSLIEHGSSEIDKFAALTGGDTFTGSKQADLERLYTEVTEQARNQYTLTFNPQDIHTNTACHSIEVRVERPGMNVTARQGYCPSAATSGR